MTTRIEIVDLAKRFGSGASAARAVDGISLTIEPGELFFLLGPSGCGKTTLLRMIAGFIDPTGGKIRFDGRDVTGVAPNKRNTGMVFQSYALWPHMTVEANVAFGLNVRNVAKREQKQRVREALAAVRMEEYATRKPNQLSGGQQQRVALARALVIRPDVLLLDEPLSNLDAKLRLDLRSEIRRVCKASGLTTVYVTHDQKEALSMADRVAILDAGKVVQVGSPRSCYRSPANRFVAEFLGETNFIRGVVAGRAGETPDSGSDGVGLVRVDTAAGPLVGRATGAEPRRGSSVTCSVRPEALRARPASGLTEQVNALGAVHRSTTYLGELAQHVVELQSVRGGSAGVVKLAELNPSGVGHDWLAEGTECVVSAEPEDVVVLSDDGPSEAAPAEAPAEAASSGVAEGGSVARTANTIEDAIRGGAGPRGGS